MKSLLVLVVVGLLSCNSDKTISVKKYELLEKYHRTELEKDVNDAIKQGWQPLGGINVAQLAGDANGQVYTQAVVK